MDRADDVKAPRVAEAAVATLAGAVPEVVCESEGVGSVGHRHVVATDPKMSERRKRAKEQQVAAAPPRIIDEFEDDPLPRDLSEERCATAAGPEIDVDAVEPPSSSAPDPISSTPPGRLGAVRVGGSERGPFPAEASAPEETDRGGPSIHVTTVDAEEERRRLAEEIERDLRRRMDEERVSAAAAGVLDSHRANGPIATAYPEGSTTPGGIAEDRSDRDVEVAKMKWYRRPRFKALVFVAVIVAAAVAVAVGVTASSADENPTASGAAASDLNSDQVSFESPSGAPSAAPSRSVVPSAAPTAAPSRSPTPYWIQVGTDLHGGKNYDYFGQSVSISANGTRVAIGAHKGDYGGYSSGEVRVFDLLADRTTTQVGSTVGGVSSSAYLGYSVSLSASGTRFAAGAPYWGPDNSGKYTGYVKIFDLVDDDWVEMPSDIRGPKRKCYTGSSVALSADGTRLVVGSRLDESGHTDGYPARAYEVSGDGWVRLGKVLGDTYGKLTGESRDVSISHDGSVIAVVEMYVNRTNWGEYGVVKVFNFVDSDWAQTGTSIQEEDAEDEDDYSVSLSADGMRLAIGVPFRDIVRVYDFADTDWSLSGEIMGSYRDEFGWSVSLSSDGMRIAIGATDYEVADMYNAGQVRIYDFEEGNWTQIGAEINGTKKWSQTGTSVSLAADGSRVAIGSPRKDAGHISIFETENI